MPSEKPNLFKWGFKTWAEKTAVEYRQKLALDAHDYLPPIALAEYLGVRVIPVTEFPGEVNCLCLAGWSALTMVNHRRESLILFNPFHSQARQHSDLMHELAHVICDHKSPEHYRDLVLPDDVRSFNDQHEAEAQYFGGCLQIPRQALIWAQKSKMNEEQIAQRFLASIDMVRYRIRITGVSYQFRTWRK